jgi:CO/xanthine dehydrogenase FAD-binding subunit
VRSTLAKGDALKTYEYHKPHTVEEALNLMKTLDEGAYIAGGTDVMVLVRQGKLRLRHMVSLRAVEGLAFIAREKGLRIGGGTTHSDIEADEFIAKRYSALSDAVENLGSRQIRNVATMGGNICNAAPSADTACPLLVLDARVVIAGYEGERTIDIDEFFLGPGKTVLVKGDIVREFAMPAFEENTGSAYLKHTRRAAMDLPILGVAARITVKVGGSQPRCHDALCTIDTMSKVLERFEEEDLRCEDVRIAMGVVAPRPVRARKAEAALRGQVLSEKVFREIGDIAASEATPRDSVRGEAWYRREMVSVLTKRAIMKSVERIIRPDSTVYPERLW